MLPAAGGCEPLDLLLADFEEFVAGLAAALALPDVDAAARAPELAEAGCTLGVLAGVTFFALVLADFAAGFAAARAGASAAVVSTISTGALDGAGVAGACAGVTAAAVAGVCAGVTTAAVFTDAPAAGGFAATAVGMGAGVGAAETGAGAAAITATAGLSATVVAAAAGRAALLG